MFFFMTFWCYKLLNWTSYPLPKVEYVVTTLCQYILFMFTYSSNSFKKIQIRSLIGYIVGESICVEKLLGTTLSNEEFAEGDHNDKSIIL